jgi:microcystin degradation protein MlrC
MARIAVGGFQHETNTFAPVKADFTAFEQADAWPALTRGDGLFAAVAGINLPLTGFVTAAEVAGHTLLPLSWCSASPSAHVTEDAFERIAAMLLDDIAAAKPDAIYLDLHGAMVTEHFEDGEGLLLSRVRALVGPDVPIVASLDLHANISTEMCHVATALVSYRSYPHIDMAETGARAAKIMGEILAADGAAANHFRPTDFLIPINAQCTMLEPAGGLYRRLGELEAAPGVWSLSFAMGFPPADISICGPSVYGVGADAEAVKRAVEALADEITAAESNFTEELFKPDAAVRLAMENLDPRPFIIADTQDNPGAGGNSDTVGMLESLMRCGAKGAVFAILFDPEVAEAAHKAGEGRRFDAALGAKSGQPGQRPFEGKFRVERLGNGHFTATGPMWHGARMELGPMALLQVEDKNADVRVIVSSRKFQAADQSVFRHLGLEPAEQKILVLKSSVHFRADFQPLAATIITAIAPGPNLADTRKFPYRHLRPGLRIKPNGPRVLGPDAGAGGGYCSYGEMG